MSISREVIAVNANLVIMEITAKQVRDIFPELCLYHTNTKLFFPPNEFSVYVWVKNAFHFRVPKTLTFKPTG